MMKAYPGSKWALMLAGVFAAAAVDEPSSSPPGPTGPAMPGRQQAAEQKMEAIQTSLHTAAVVMPVAGAKAESCHGPLKAEIKEACLEGRPVAMPAVELARNTGALLAHGKDGVGFIVDILQGLYPSSKKRLAEKEKAAPAP